MFTNPTEIASEADRIYQEDLKDKLEESNHGHYVAIDVLTGKYYLGDYAEHALMKAREKAPRGVFHLIKIGGLTSLGARYIGRQKTTQGWIF